MVLVGLLTGDGLRHPPHSNQNAWLTGILANRAQALRAGGQRVHRRPAAISAGLGLQVACPLKQGHVYLLLTCRTGQQLLSARCVCVCVCVALVSAHGCTGGQEGQGAKHGGMPGLGSPQGRATVSRVPGAELPWGTWLQSCSPVSLLRSSGISRTQQPWPGAMPQAPSSSGQHEVSRAEAQSPSLRNSPLHRGCRVPAQLSSPTWDHHSLKTQQVWGISVHVSRIQPEGESQDRSAKPEGPGHSPEPCAVTILADATCRLSVQPLPSR